SLNVNGAVNIASPLNVGSVSSALTSASGSLGIAGSKVWINSSGNVGIGTTTPITKLTLGASANEQINVGGGRIIGLNTTPINADEAVPLTYLQSNYAPIGSGAGSAFVQGGNSFGGVATLGTNDNNLLNIETNNTARMTVAAGGNIGVGTTAPQVGMKMDVRSDSGDGNSAITAYGYNGNGGMAIKGQGYATNGIGSNYGIYGLSNGVRASGTNIGGYFTASGALNNYALITGTGNVGIGTTVPLGKLQIGNVTSGTAEPTYHGSLIIQDSPASLEATGGIEFKYSSSGSGYGWKVAALNDAGYGLGFGSRIGSTTWSPKMYINGSTGNVGIVATYLKYKLCFYIFFY
ncbi:hypothetical protein K9M09_02170, partial [Patescibacteria group bacterium]|nr:hypothetical protein [Patescibacteria group bacterium]